MYPNLSYVYTIWHMTSPKGWYMHMHMGGIRVSDQRVC